MQHEHFESVRTRPEAILVMHLHDHWTTVTAMIGVAIPAINDLIRLQTRAALQCLPARVLLSRAKAINFRCTRSIQQVKVPEREGLAAVSSVLLRPRRPAVRALAGRETRASASTVLGVQHALLPSVYRSCCQRPFPRLQIRRRFKCSAFVLRTLQCTRRSLYRRRRRLSAKVSAALPAPLPLLCSANFN